MKIIKVSGNLTTAFERHLKMDCAKAKLKFLKQIKSGTKELKDNGRTLIIGNDLNDKETVYKIVPDNY